MSKNEEKYINSVNDNAENIDYDKSAVRDFRAMGIKYNAYEYSQIEAGAANLKLTKLTFVRFASCLLTKIAEKMSSVEKYELDLTKPEFILDLLDINVTRKKSVKGRAELRGYGS